MRPLIGARCDGGQAGDPAVRPKRSEDALDRALRLLAARARNQGREPVELEEGSCTGDSGSVVAAVAVATGTDPGHPV